MPWARMMAYAGWVEALRAEEQIGALAIAHTADPKELANRLRAAAAGYTTSEYEMAKTRAMQSANMLQAALESKRGVKRKRA